MKVKVRSIFREVLAKTGRVWTPEGKEVPQFRQFTPPQRSVRDGVPIFADFGEAYMTPTEAAFLVESKENQAFALAGKEQPYHYPMGYPVPETDDAGGTRLLPPITQTTMHVSDDRQLIAAEAIMKERDEAVARHAAEASGEVLPEELDGPQETAKERRERVKAERAISKAKATESAADALVAV